MGIKSQSIVAVDDDVRTLDRISMILDSTHIVLATADAKRAMTWLQNDATVSAIVVGHNLQGGQGVGLLEAAKNIRPEARRILIANYSDLAQYVEGLHSARSNGRFPSRLMRPSSLGLVRVRAIPTKPGGAAGIAAA